jgi:hypothetical protein
MERLRGKMKVDAATTTQPQVRKNRTKSPKIKTQVESRTLNLLIQDFKASSGNFEEFHSSMNGREKILFKGYINSMRDSEV